ncbi:MAG: hypothetical protein A2Y86_05360 [Candidatus Aminicenantes bacterium RBG_13_62_12]|nr:MAG: hypothetical protein A2Y86_05360 [Candidatus Aminicenantes bacterium RBG_13_62_12]
MDAETYITSHWIPRRVWTHLAWPRHQERLRRCAELMPPAGRVLDVGCACGHSTEIMRRFRPELEWSGADFSRTGITMAAVFFKHMKFYLVPQPNDLSNVGKFDGVVCSEVLEHTPDDGALVDALIQVAAGTLVMTTPWARVSDPGHLRVYTEEALLALFAKPGHPGTLRIEREDKFFYLVYARER